MTAASARFRFGTERAAPRVVLRPISVAERLASPQYGLLWLVRLRWHALVALAVAMTLAPYSMGVSVPWLPAVGLVTGIGVSNLGCLAWLRSDRPVRTSAIGLVLVVDTALLTAALRLSGGALNPFVALYVIQATLAALLLGVGWVVAVGIASAIGYGVLLASPHAAVAPGPEGSLAALAITLGINATLVVRMVAAYRERQEALASAQREAAQAEKLASLTTLAAGAAHELATPLGTIAVAATELEALLVTAPEHAALEARLIREQVARCKHILQRLGARAGSEPGELPRATTGGEAFDRVRDELGARAERLDTQGDRAFSFDAPIESLVGVLANLVSNGLQASPPDARVTLELSARGGEVRFTATDRGSGITPALLPRLGEPFMTTKAPGEGLGLGLFLAFRFARACGGRLHVESELGRGTRVHLDLPRTPGVAR
ncbi:MAG TPA: ATP-binding protein [Polyangiaceae bacterium]|nr:ATP-binding protein [Polyangiaceae bacterium]